MYIYLPGKELWMRDFAFSLDFLSFILICVDLILDFGFGFGATLMGMF